MKRRRGWLFNLASAASALLCIAISVLWVRSHLASDWVQHEWAGRRVTIGAFSAKGKIALAYDRGGQGFSTISPQLFLGIMPTNIQPVWTNLSGVMGFNIIIAEGYLKRNNSMFQIDTLLRRNRAAPPVPPPGATPDTTVYILIPYWMIMVLAIPLPAYWLLDRRRHARTMGEGLCKACGYDLRATPERCPECGTIPPREKTGQDMKRLRRWLLNFAAAVSLVLCVVTIVVWERSYRATDWIEWHADIAGPTYTMIISGHGDCVINCVRVSFPYRESSWRLSTQNAAYDLNGQWGRWASERRSLLWVITWGRARNANNTTNLAVLFPYWLLTFMTLIPPASLLFVRLRQRWRKRDGICTKCGYDLRATPDRCPECGTIPEAAAKEVAT